MEEVNNLKFVKELGIKEKASFRESRVFGDVVATQQNEDVCLWLVGSDSTAVLKNVSIVPGSGGLWCAGAQLTRYQEENGVVRAAETVAVPGADYSRLVIHQRMIFQHQAGTLTVSSVEPAGAAQLVGQAVQRLSVPADVFCSSSERFLVRQGDRVSVYRTETAERLWDREVTPETAAVLAGDTVLLITPEEITAVGEADSQLELTLDLEEAGKYRAVQLTKVGPLERVIILGHTGSVDLQYLVSTGGALERYLPAEDADGIQIPIGQTLENLYVVEGTNLPETNLEDQEIIQGPTVLLETDKKLVPYYLSLEVSQPQRYASTRRPAIRRELGLKVAGAEPAGMSGMAPPATRKTAPADVHSPIAPIDLAELLDPGATPPAAPSAAPTPVPSLAPTLAPIDLSSFGRTLDQLKGESPCVSTGKAATTQPRPSPPTPRPISLESLARPSRVKTAEELIRSIPESFQASLTALADRVQEIRDTIEQSKRELAELPRDTKLEYPPVKTLLSEVEELVVLLKDEEIRIKNILKERATAKREKSQVLIQIITERLGRIDQILSQPPADYSREINYINTRITALIKATTSLSTPKLEKLDPNAIEIYSAPLTMEASGVEPIARMNTLVSKQNENLTLIEECLKKIQHRGVPKEDILEHIFKERPAKEFLATLNTAPPLSTSGSQPVTKPAPAAPPKPGPILEAPKPAPFTAPAAPPKPAAFTTPAAPPKPAPFTTPLTAPLTGTPFSSPTPPAGLFSAPPTGQPAGQSPMQPPPFQPAGQPPMQPSQPGLHGTFFPQTNNTLSLLNTGDKSFLSQGNQSLGLAPEKKTGSMFASLFKKPQ